MQPRIQITQVPIAKLKPSDYNPRKWDEKSIENLTASIKEFGLVDPIIANSAKARKNIVIGGHFRLKIAKDLGYKTVPVVYTNIPSIDREKELNIRLNKNTGEFDYELLAKFDNDLLVKIGFESIDLDKIYKPEASPEDDEVPEVRKTNIKLGDMFKLGEHRLLCGDSTKKEDVEWLMQGEKADMVFTDPPYAVNYGADQDILNKKSGGKSKLTARPIMGDNMTAKECSEKLWRPAFKNMYDFAKDNCSFYMTMCQGGDQMMMMMMSENWQVKHELIWVKSSPVFSMGRLDYDYQHEPILFGWKKKHNWYGGGQFLKSIWEIDKPHKSKEHPTMKPIALMENALLNSSQRDEICLDLFGGSGSTLIACEKTERKCRMIELDPQYCQVIIDRWEQLTNKKAEKQNE